MYYIENSFRSCISSIMSLLRMSSPRVPAADDILPVLIYVVIMVSVARVTPAAT